MTIQSGLCDALWDLTSEAILVADADGVITRANKAAAEMLTYADDEFVGRSVTFLLPELSSPTTKPGTVKTFAISKQGDEIPVRVAWARYQDHDQWFLAFTISDLREAYATRDEVLTQYLTHAPAACRVRDLSGRYLVVNDAAAEPYGLRPTDMIGKTPEEFGMTPELKGKLAAIEARVIESGIAETFEADEFSGDPRAVKSTVFPIVDPDGDIVATGGIGISITDLKLLQSEHEQTLRDLSLSNQRLRSFVDNTPLATIEVNAERDITFWSKQCEALFGYRADEVLGKKINELNFVHPEDLPRVKSSIEEFLDTKSPSSTIVNRNLHKDGHEVVCEWHGAGIFDNNGNFLRRIAIAVDLTERYQMQARVAESEDRLEKAIAASHEGIYDVKLLPKEQIWASDRFLEMTGFETAADLPPAAEQPYCFIHPDDHEQVRQALRQRDKNTNRFFYEARFFNKDREPRWTRATGHLSRDENGQVSRIVGTIIDIHEVRATERALADSHERISYYLDNSFMLHVELDAEANVLGWSKTAEEILGYREDEVLGQPASMFIYTDDDDVITQKIATPTGNQWRTTNRNVTKDGRVLTMDWFNSVRRDADGNILSTMSFAIDRSAETKTQHELNAALERLKFHLSNQLMLNLEVDAEGKITSWSESAQTVLGYSEDEMIGRSSDSFVYHEDRQLVANYFAQFSEPNFTQWHLVNRNVHKDGRILTLEWFSTVLRDEEGNMLSNLAFAIDRTEEYAAHVRLSEALERLQYHVDNQLMLVIETDSHGAITSWSKSAEDLLGYQAGEMIGKSQMQIVHPEDKADVLQLFETINDPGTVQLHLTNRNIHKDGRVLHLEWFSTVLRDEEGNTKSNLAFALDRTSEIKAKEELERSNNELAQFAYAASHDLQEPLRMISSYSDIIMRDHATSLDDEAMEYFGYVTDGAKRMRQLIKDLLEFSRAGHGGLRNERVQLNDVLDSVLFSLKPAIAETNADISATNLPILQGDVHQLNLLLQNLIGNAIKYSSATPKITISADYEGSGCRIRIRDNGIGIEERFHERIFNVFERLHGRHEYSGTGIGLAICKRIVERHGGEIGVTSSPDQGSTFWFTLPEVTRPNEQHSATPADSHLVS